jgi:CIC family chloride channel protein
MHQEHLARRGPVASLLRRPRILWRRMLRHYTRGGLARWLAIGVVAGLLSGLLAVLFYLGLESLKQLLQVRLAGISLPSPAGESLFHGSPGPFRPWLIPVFLGLVGLITGYVVTKFIPDSLAGVTDGTDATIKAFHRSSGPAWVPCSPRNCT